MNVERHRTRGTPHKKHPAKPKAPAPPTPEPAAEPFTSHGADDQPRDIERGDVPQEPGPDERGELDRRYQW
jgi:hypothetical protein